MLAKGLTKDEILKKVSEQIDKDKKDAVALEEILLLVEDYIKQNIDKDFTFGNIEEKIPVLRQVLRDVPSLEKFYKRVF